MPLPDRKIPIITGINNVPSTQGQPNHPNDSLLCANYNGLIDDLPNEITALARQAISVTGTASYNATSGLITIPPNQFSFHDRNNVEFYELIQYLMSVNTITAFYNSQGINLSSSGGIFYNDFGLIVVSFETSAGLFTPNEWHTFPFGDIRVNNNQILFQLNTIAFTTDFILPFFIQLADNQNNLYYQKVQIIVSSTLQLANYSSGGSGSGGSGSGGSGS